MSVPTIAGLLMWTIALSSCRAPDTSRAPRALASTPIFGPVVSNEVIAGRADDDGGGVWLLVGGADLVHVDLDGRVASRAPIALAAGEQCWGLARLQDGSLWTLKGRHTVIQIDARGVVTKELELSEPHFGLFGAADRLVYQPAHFTQAEPALRAAAPGDLHTLPWSALTTREFSTLARASAAALNIVMCGGTARAERPCWFPDEAAIALVDASGHTRRLQLGGLTVVPPEILLTSDNPARPIRDAYVDALGTIWILSSGAPPPGAPETPGGWLLARYTFDGVLLGVDRLAESTRLVLRAGSNRALVLTGAGMVAEVRP